ncbi:MAG: DUF2330 domain-containing protein [Deltaproteobacteria bacterium]|nr:DUF2330 domain-containing protein [Deltaproteobacteria bacterium]
MTFKATESAACGGCVNGPTMLATSVLDHRMVLALSSAQTTLWDQLRYAGDPSQFLWILPVSDASTIEVAVGTNAFVNGIDAFSAPTIVGPGVVCGRDNTVSYVVARSTVNAPAGSFAEVPTERVVLGDARRAAVGPYATEVVRSREQGLATWLRARRFAVDSSNEAAIAHYESMRFDFLVVQFRPGVSVQQIQPIRVSTRGYNPVLPLRFIALGAGDSVGLSLMVLAPTAMVPEGWDSRTLDSSALVWDFGQGTSNYRSLLGSASALGTAWVVESVSQPARMESILAFDATQPARARSLPSRGVIPADCPFPEEAGEPIRGPDVDGATDPDAASAWDAAEALDARREPEDPTSAPDAAAPDAGHDPDAGDPRCQPVVSTTPNPIGPIASDTQLLSAMIERLVVVTRLHLRVNPRGLDRDLRLTPTLAALDAPPVRLASQGLGGRCSPQPFSWPMRQGWQCTTPASRTHDTSTPALMAVTLACALASRRRAARA